MSVLMPSSRPTDPTVNNTKAPQGAKSQLPHSVSPVLGHSVTLLVSVFSFDCYHKPDSVLLQASRHNIPRLDRLQCRHIGNCGDHTTQAERARFGVEDSDGSCCTLAAYEAVGWMKCALGATER